MHAPIIQLGMSSIEAATRNLKPQWHIWDFLQGVSSLGV